MNTFVPRIFSSGLLALFICCGLAEMASAHTVTLRIVTYNIEDDINNATTPLPGLITPSASTNVLQGGVLEGIGEEILSSDPPQPLDILALEETTGNSITVAPIVNGLNAFYHFTNQYAMSTYQATESGGDTADGNGPNAVVYNSATVQLVASVPVDPPGGTGTLGSSSGEYREVMRYEFAPAGVTPASSNEFYIYVSHYKSGTSSSDLTDRGKEAVIIRNDEAKNLPASARVIYVGDYNVTTSGEASYQTILTTTSPGGVAQGGGFDPLNPTGANNINWNSSAEVSLMTESATDLRYRDDFQVMTSNVYYGVADGLALVPGTYHSFGNNGSVALKGSVGAGDTALNNDLESNPPISASSLYQYLTTASDHLPVVADYTITVPDPLTPYEEWQLQYFGCTNCAQSQAGADADGTGQNNYFKYVAGLNPTNPASTFVFQVSAVGQSNTTSLTFSPVVAGRTYAPQFSSDLGSDIWQTLNNANPPVTNGSAVTFTDTNAVQSQKFYRLNISLP